MSDSVASLSDLAPVGSALVRPECVLATARGDLYTGDWRGGVVHIRTNGSQVLYTGQCADLGEQPYPNGIALEPDGSFLLAHLGERQGGVYKLTRDGELTPVLQHVDGEDLPPTNFVTRDLVGRVWVTVSTRKCPRSEDYISDAAGGFIVLLDENGARIVADGLAYTNECRVSADGRWLYVNETYGRRLSRFRLFSDGGLGPKEVVAELGAGQFPDGLALDVDGGVWLACILGNQVLRVSADGAVSLWLDGGDPDHVAHLEDLYVHKMLRPEHVNSSGGSVLGNLSSIAFGGPGLRNAYLGSLMNDHLLRLQLPVAGVPLAHWNSTIH